MTLFSKILTVAAAALALSLTGCASKEPLDYLPEGAAYLAINMDEVRESAGSQRLLKVIQQLGSSPVAADSKAQRLYFSFSAPPQGSAYGVMTGRPGFAEAALADLKAAGGSDSKVDGRRAVTSDKFSLSPMGDNAVLFFGAPSDLTRMIQTSKRKSPGAAQTRLFQKARDLATSGGVALAINSAPLLQAAGPQLGMLALMNPKGVETLKQSDSLLLTLDWDEAPSVEATITGPEDGRAQLADLINSLLGRLKESSPGPARGMGGLPELVKRLTATSGPEGVELSLRFTPQEAESLLSRLESTAASLPTDPAERRKALQQALTARQ